MLFTKSFANGHQESPMDLCPFADIFHPKQNTKLMYFTKSLANWLRVSPMDSWHGNPSQSDPMESVCQHFPPQPQHHFDVYLLSLSRTDWRWVRWSLDTATRLHRIRWNPVADIFHPNHSRTDLRWVCLMMAFIDRTQFGFIGQPSSSARCLDHPMKHCHSCLLYYLKARRNPPKQRFNSSHANNSKQQKNKESGLTFAFRSRFSLSPPLCSYANKQHLERLS